MRTYDCKAKNKANCRYHGPMVDNELFGIRHKIYANTDTTTRLTETDSLYLFVTATPVSEEAKAIATHVINKTYADSKNEELDASVIMENIETEIATRKAERIEANKRPKTPIKSDELLVWELEYEVKMRTDGWIEAGRFAAFNPKPEK